VYRQSVTDLHRSRGRVSTCKRTVSCCQQETAFLNELQASGHDAEATTRSTVEQVLTSAGGRRYGEVLYSGSLVGPRAATCVAVLAGVGESVSGLLVLGR